MTLTACKYNIQNKELQYYMNKSVYHIGARISNVKVDPYRGLFFTCERLATTHMIYVILKDGLLRRPTTT